MTNFFKSSRITRRGFFALLGIGTGSVFLGLWKFQNSIASLLFSRLVDNRKFAENSLSFTDTEKCVVTAESVEGPYFVSISPLRSDIRENQEGRRLRIELKVVNAHSCAPIAGAKVHVWHANAQGYYSGYPNYNPDVIEFTPHHLKENSSDRYLRGYQISDENGRVNFETIFPAWYSFRTPHVHVKIQITDKFLLTTQLYFPEEINRSIRDSIDPYRQRPNPIVNNNSDPIIAEMHGASGGWPKITRGINSDVASLTIGVLFS